MNQVATLQPSMNPSIRLARQAAPVVRPRPGGRAAYLVVLTWAFTLFSALRTMAYLPTMWAIQVSGDSSQHSIWTWCTWVGANLTMAAWLYEQDGQRLGSAAVVSLGNAVMCAVTLGLIVAHRNWSF